MHDFLSDQLTQVEKERAELKLHMEKLAHELNTAQIELNKTVNQNKEAQNQIQMLSKEKGNIHAYGARIHVY